MVVTQKKTNMENESKYARKQRLLAKGAIGTEYKVEETPIIPKNDEENAIKKNEEKIIRLQRTIVQINELISIGKRKAQLYVDMGSTNLADNELTKVVKYEEYLEGLKNAIEKRKLKIDNIKKQIKN